MTFVISFGGGLMLGFHPTHYPPPNSTTSGWRPYIWTRNVAQAETFMSEAAAELYARGSLKHEHYTVVGLPLVPFNPNGDCA